MKYLSIMAIVATATGCGSETCDVFYESTFGSVSLDLGISCKAAEENMTSCGYTYTINDKTQVRCLNPVTIIKK